MTVWPALLVHPPGIPFSMNLWQESGGYSNFPWFWQLQLRPSTHIPLENVGIACAHTAALVLIDVGRGGGAGAGALLAAPTAATDSRHQFSALYTASTARPGAPPHSRRRQPPALLPCKRAAVFRARSSCVAGTHPPPATRLAGGVVLSRRSLTVRYLLQLQCRASHQNNPTASIRAIPFQTASGKAPNMPRNH